MKIMDGIAMVLGYMLIGFILYSAIAGNIHYIKADQNKAGIIIGDKK